MSSQPTPSPPPSSTTSPSPDRQISDDDRLASSPGKREVSSEPPPTATRTTPVFPSREDCWSEEATRTLIDAWGAHYLDLNRGNLRQKHWQGVADAVNALHAASFKLRRTDIQCKNRIDTTKKKYKIEKSKVSQSNGRYVSTWPHFQSLDSLIGDSFSKTTTTNAHTRNLRRRVSPSPEFSPPPSEPPIHRRKKSPARRNHPEKDPAPSQTLRIPWSVPVGPRSKRSGPGSVTERNFSVMAAAAAAMEAEELYEKEEEEEEEEEDDYNNELDDYEECGRRPPEVGMKRKRKEAAEDEAAAAATAEDGYRSLAEAISRLGEIYKKVEEAKQRQMVEMEKQRMQFAKDLEIQRMKVFMESQVHLEKLKRNSKHNSENNSYL
ncbi:hypothetical protein ACP275_13G037600 [Erythranthe tilingii]